MKLNDFLNSFNVEIGGFRIEDVAEKVGFMLFGETGRFIGKMIDDKTKDKTIRIGTDTEKDRE